MNRLAFNGGELDPASAMRSDLDAFHRGASIIENFDVQQMGGIKRRKGMRYLTETQDRLNSRIIPYIYSTTDRYVIEINEAVLRILSPDGKELTRFDSKWSNVRDMRYRQMNNLLLLLHKSVPVHVLKRNDAGDWSLTPFDFKNQTWKDSGFREHGLTVTGVTSETYRVSMSSLLDETERRAAKGDLMRASFMTNTAEGINRRTLLAGNVIADKLPALMNAIVGQKIAYRSEVANESYMCIKQWDQSQNLIGTFLASPLNYPDFFVRIDNAYAEAPTWPVYDSLNNMPGITAVGFVFGIKSGYYNYWTCIKNFNSATDYVPGKDSYDDYPGHFIKGIAVGNPLPCKGPWHFYCSGTWYGEYVIRRSYEGTSLNAEWEDRGRSFSRLGSASNTLVSGDESGEECWMRLFLTKSKYDATLANGIATDTCSNRLVIPSYKHDMILECPGDINGIWKDVTPVKVPFVKSREISDWSWQAFRDVYGYPALCDVYNQRLVFASTKAQPQTVWMSKSDDLNNFLLGKQDDSAMALTLSTTTQNPICWMMAQSSRLLLGTADGEWVISGGGDVLTHSTARADNHGYVGSANVPAIMATDKVIYCERGGGRLYQYGYDYESDAYVSRDLTVFASHILADGGGIVDGAFIRKPDSRAIFVRTDGQIAIMTYNSMHEVNAWHRYTTNGTIHSVAVLPNGNEPDSIYLVVERKDGTYIEVIDDKSEYVDNRNNHYASIMTTNALTTMDTAGRMRDVAEVKIYLAHDTKVDGFTVSNDGSKWVCLDRTSRYPLERGWHVLVADGKWDYDGCVGIKVEGNQPFQALSIEG